MGFEAERIYEDARMEQLAEDLTEQPIPKNWVEEHWTDTLNGLTRCRKHGTIFAQQEEPCWGCYNEAQII